jgi:hypothetical protein
MHAQVFKATWKGITVAVNVMVLPSHVNKLNSSMNITSLLFILFCRYSRRLAQAPFCCQDNGAAPPTFLECCKDEQSILLCMFMPLVMVLQVFKATWKGTTVAVKIMVLPSYMTGKEKREKMAVMETAISSSLSHPNVVQVGA